MPRARLYIFNMLTVVSLLLMVATVGLWVRSDRMMRDEFKYVDAQVTLTTWQARYVSVESRNGQLEFAHGNFEPLDPQLLDRREKDLLVLAIPAGPGWRDHAERP